MRKQFCVILLLLGFMALANDLFAQGASKDSGPMKEREAEKISRPSNKDSQNTGDQYKFSGEKYNTGWAFYLDNDALSFLDLDQDFTFGLALTLSGRRATEYFFSLDKPLKLIDRLIRCLSYILRGRTEAIKGSNARTPIWGGLIISRAL